MDPVNIDMEAVDEWLAHGIEVIVCTFNGERYVAEQLRSIVAQSMTVGRISIYDDCSTDATLATVERFRSETQGGPAITLSANPQNLGYAQNFASAIARATGRVLFLSDQDDLWEPEKVRTMVELMELTGADMVFSDGTPINADGNAIAGPTVLQALGLSTARIADFPTRAWQELLRRNVVNGAACAVRCSVAKAALPLPGDIPHDHWLALWCQAHNGVAVTPERLYRYRQHEGNAIGMGSQRWLYHWLGVWRQPRKPRLRELGIWRAVHARLAPLVAGQQRALLDEKLQFLEAVVAPGDGVFARFRAVVRHARRGSYRRYAPPMALHRDLVGLWRGDRAERGVTGP